MVEAGVFAVAVAVAVAPNIEWSVQGPWECGITRFSGDNTTDLATEKLMLQLAHVYGRYG